jgi:hypothetical protein
MEAKDIKPIPKYIQKIIKKRDVKAYPLQNGIRRFYAYLTKFDGELVKVTVAVRNRKNKAKDWVCKQVAVHLIHSKQCFVKDMAFYYVGGYVVGWYEQGLQNKPKWFESPQWGTIDNKIFDPYAPVVNAEYALKFEKYKYSHADEYKYCDLFKYLRAYEKYPQAEYLMKLGLYQYAASIQILRKIGTDKAFRKWVINNKTELNRTYYVSTVLSAYKTNKPLPETQKFETAKKRLNSDFLNKPIRELFKYDLEKFFLYIEKQNTSTQNYLDYLNACNYLHLDMSIDKNRFPHDFKRWHDIRIDEYHSRQAAEDEKQRKEFYQKFAYVSEKYLPLQRNMNDSFIAIIARTPQDLVREGDYLHHCVGRMGYDQKFAREETLIFFIRNIDSPDTPFVTLEYSLSTHKVLQCYGDNDSKPNENVMTFVNKKWLPYANRKLKKLTAAA